MDAHAETIQDSTNQKELPRSGMVHFILSHSYIVFLIAVVIGAVLHLMIRIQIFSGILYPYIGFIMIVVGSLLIYWAQSTSDSTLKQLQKSGKRDFESGPYKYSRSPTHVGLTIMTLGLAIVLNSFFIAACVIIASVVTKLIFLKEEEALLERRYGQPYLDYKKKVSSWL